MHLNPEDILKIGLAVVAGGIIGIEREFRDKAAGFRTLIFISTGATLFTILSVLIARDKDPGRVAANIVTGVGFLGAGVIMRDGGRITGLTTAATIWMTAAVGMAIGSGQYLLSGVMVLTALMVLWLFPYLEIQIDQKREERTYEIVCPASIKKFEQLEVAFRECGLRVQNQRQIKSGDEMTCSWHTSGAPQNHKHLIQKFLEDPDIKEFRF